jgi:hypothetical protein
MFDNTLDTSVSVYYDNVYFARFSNTGNLMWSSYFGGDGKSYRTTLGADRFGNVFFSGEWSAVVNPATYPLVYPGSPTFTSSFMGFEDLYVAKLSNNLPVQTFSYTSLCISDTNRLPSLAPGFLTGGTFSAAPGLSINPQTGHIITAASVPGNYTVSYNQVPCYCPGAVAKTIGTATISILTAPSLTIIGKNSVCIGEKATYTASGSTTYTWNTGSTSSTIGITPSTTSTVIYTVSSKGSNGCVAKKNFTIAVSKCTGIEGFEIGSANLEIFPNPNSGQFTIFSDKDIQLEIVNEMGQVIKVIELSAKNERKIDIHDLANGIYFLRDKNAKQTGNYKIVITN